MSILSACICICSGVIFIDDIIESLYQSIGVKDLEEENIVDYYNTYLTKEEIVELNNTIKSKIAELIHKRESDDDSLLYDIVMVSTPINKKEIYNL
jgi:protoheme ferro-lyase